MPLLPDHDLTEPLAKLEALGSPEQIALYFEAEGITGALGNAAACPVSQYLHRETCLAPEATIISVGIASVSVLDLVSPSPSGTLTRYPLPEAVGEFVRAFDNDEYPHLDDHSAGSW